jgi:glutamine synthetase
MATNTAETVLQLAAENGVRFINLQFTDIMGMVKSITLPLSQLELALTDGIWFDGSSIEGFARISESDMFLVPEPSTFAIIPWRDGSHKTGRLICNVYTPDGDLFIGAPRAALMRATKGWAFPTRLVRNWNSFYLAPTRMANRIRTSSTTAPVILMPRLIVLPSYART